MEQLRGIEKGQSSKCCVLSSQLPTTVHNRRFTLRETCTSELQHPVSEKAEALIPQLQEVMTTPHQSLVDNCF